MPGRRRRTPRGWRCRSSRPRPSPRRTSHGNSWALVAVRASSCRGSPCETRRTPSRIASWSGFWVKSMLSSSARDANGGPGCRRKRGARRSRSAAMVSPAWHQPDAGRSHNEPAGRDTSCQPRSSSEVAHGFLQRRARFWQVPSPQQRTTGSDPPRRVASLRSRATPTTSSSEHHPRGMPNCRSQQPVRQMILCSDLFRERCPYATVDAL